MSATPQFCLASQSPRRRQMLAALGYEFDCAAANIDESVRAMAPEAFVAALAREKAEAVRPTTALPVLAADTVVVHGGNILGKPRNARQAGQMLAALSGDWHTVVTGVCLLDGSVVRQTTTTTRVQMTDWTAAQITAYVASGEPLDKAGAYGIQGDAAAWVAAVDGSYTGVIGLPLVETRKLLADAGIVPARPRLAA